LRSFVRMDAIIVNASIRFQFNQFCIILYTNIERFLFADCNIELFL
jgi:hypothetical protein